MLQYVKPQFKKRHELDKLRRIIQEPRYLRQKSQVESTAWKNYFFGRHETNNILNEINRSDGIMGDVVRPVRDDYLRKLQRRKADLEIEFRRSNLPPPPRM